MLGRILVGIGSILVVALFAALIAPYFIDWTGFRTDFETQASRIIGKKVVVHGSVDARILPFPSVTMTDVRVGEDETGQALVTADSFSMESELAPFLSGEALIYNMRVSRPRLRLRLTEDGTLDWVKTGNPQIAASSVTLEKVTITDGEILFVDEQAGRNRQITGLDLSLSAKSLAGPWNISGTGAVDGQPGSFMLRSSLPEQGQVAMKLRLLPDRPGIVAEMDGTLGLNGLKPQYRGKFRLREKYRSETAELPDAEPEKQSAAPRISGDFELENVRLRIPAYEFRMGDPADPYIVTGEATIDSGKAPQFLLTAEGQQIDMSRFGAAPGDAGGDTAPPIALRDRISALLTLAADIPVPSMPGEARIRLPAVISNDTTIRDIALKMRPDRDGWLIDEAEAQLPGRTTLSAKGRLGLGERHSFTGDLLLASNQPSGFAEWVTGDVPDVIRKLKTAGFAAQVDLTTDLQRFENLEIVLAGNVLKGRIERQSSADAPPALSVDMQGSEFDLDTMVALGTILTGESSSATLLAHRLAAKLKIDRFSAFGLTGTGLDAAFALADGTISDVRLKLANAYGAAITAKGGFANVTGNAKGEAEIHVAAADAGAFLDLVATKVRPHPALKRLAANARYFADSDLTLRLKLGLGDWPVEARLEGKSNGSTMAATLAAQTLNLADSGGLTLDATLENPQAWIMLGQAGLTTLPFEADADGRLSLKLNQAPDSEPQVALSFASATTSANLEGQARLDALHFLEGSYTFSLDSGDMAPYLLVAGQTLPRITEGLPASASATIYVTPEAISLENLVADVDGNNIHGILSLDRKAPRPVLGGEISLDTADLGWLAENLLGPVTDPLAGGLSQTPMAKTINLPLGFDLALGAGKFTLGALGDVSGFSGRLHVEPGKISLADSAGSFAGGQFSGRAEIGNTDGTGFLRARLDVKGATLNTSLWQFAGKPAASAQADLSMVVDTNGPTSQAMLDNATGSGALNLRNLSVNGINARSLPAILAAADTITADLSDQTVTEPVSKILFSEKSTLARLDIPFAITGGTFRASDIKAGNDTFALSAQAELDIAAGMLEASTTLSFKPGEEALAGADPALTISWSGALIAPERHVDVTALTSFLSLRKFEQERRRVDALQAKIAEKQRLRREAALFRAHENERQRLKEKAAAEERLLREAQEQLKALARAEEELRQKTLSEGVTDPADKSSPSD